MNAPSTATPEVVLELRQATKKYAGVPAIEDVDFSLRRGEVHALLGENGAGKSTLSKVLAGVVTLSSGHMLLEGREVNFKTPLEAHHHGIAMVFQETSLVPSMTVAQNLFLGQEAFFNRLRGIYIAAQQFLQSLNFDVNPTALVGMLGAAQKQMVEIARAVLNNARIIIFDEPTATLTPEEKRYFFDLVFQLKKRGVSIIFISHALEEALLLADRITILRDGKLVVTDDKDKFDRARIIQAMVGRDMSQTMYGVHKTRVRPQGECLLSVQNLRMASMVKNNSLSVFAGQVTGVFGLVGAGRTETFKVVAGLIKRDFFMAAKCVCAAARALPCAGARRARRYRLHHRRQKIRGFFRPHVDPAQHLPRRARQEKKPQAHGFCRRRARPRGILDEDVEHPRHRQKRERGGTLGRQPAEGGDRQIAGARARRHHLRRAYARRRCRRHRGNPCRDQSARRRGQGGGGDLVLSA